MTEVLRYAAFTTTPEGDNPAGVVLDADDLTEGHGVVSPITCRQPDDFRRCQTPPSSDVRGQLAT